MHPGTCVLWGCSTLPAIVPWAPQSCQNEVTKSAKLGGSGITVILFLVKSSMVENEVGDRALSWCNIQYLCHQILWQSLRTFSRSWRKHNRSIWNWLFGLPWWILCEQPLWCQNMTSMHLACLFRSLWVWTSLCKHPCTVLYFFPKHLPNHCDSFHHTTSEIWSPLLTVGFVAK
jgi:hypothetical protein